MTDMLRNLNLATVYREADISRADAAGDADNIFVACYSTGAAVRRWDWDYGDFMEELSVDPAHIRSGRLDTGALPILLDHRQGIRNQFGVVEKHWIENGRAYVQFRMETGTPEADAILNKLRQGIVRSVSVGYRIHTLIERKEADKIPTLTATDWEPFEISLVSVPADAQATTVRSDGDASAYPCHLILNRTPSTSGESHMVLPVTENPTDTQTQSPVVENRAAPAATPTVDVNAAIARALEADRQRGLAIRQLGARHGIESAAVEALVAEGITEVDASRKILDMLGERSQATGTASTIRVGYSYDAPEVVARAWEDALASRLSPQSVRPEGKALEFMGRSMMEGYHEVLLARGERPITSKAALIERALHTTSDFPVMLGGVIHRTVVADHAAAPATFRELSSQINFTDFRDQEFLTGSEFPALQRLGEGGEIRSASIDDGTLETARVDTQAVKIHVSRELLANDSTGYLSQHFGKMGRRIAAQENKAVYDYLASNPKLKRDNKAVFHADHKNLHATAVASPDEAILSAMRTVMASYESDDIPLNFNLAYLLIDPSLQTATEKLLSDVYSTKTGDVNVFANKFKIIVDQAIASHNAWYGWISKSDTSFLVHGYYNGEGPKVDTQPGWNTLGMELRVYKDFGFGIIGDKGAYKVRKSL